MIESLGPLQEIFVAEARQIEQDSAPDDAAAGDRLYAGFHQPAVRRRGWIAVPKPVVEPHVAERVAVGARLGKAAYIIVGELKPAPKRPPVSRIESRLVRDHVVAGRPPSRKDRVACRSRDRRTQGERAMAVNGGDSQLDFFAGQIVQGSDFIVRAPPPPISRRISQ